jgi:gluconate 2-dehydrogenase gamma chain
MGRRLSRRSVLKRAAAVGAASAVPAATFTQPADEAWVSLSPALARTLEAIVARLIPSDGSGPGALEAGAARYIDRGLGDALSSYRDLYTAGLAALDAHARRRAGDAFADLEPGQQDALLEELEGNAIPDFESAAFFETVLEQTLEGTFCDPRYGGNRDFIGWEMIGYPGIRLAVGPAEQAMDAELEPTRISAYDLPMFDSEDTDDSL